MINTKWLKNLWVLFTDLGQLKIRHLQMIDPPHWC